MRTTLRDRAYRSILKQILHGELPPNTPITEIEYCERLHMSRTPLREALKQLETEGLVYKVTDRGVFVKEITLTDIEEISELRKMFELQALRYAITRITDEEIAECRRLLGELDVNRDPQSFFQADKSFHKLLMRYCPNQRLIGYYQNISNQIERFQRLLAQQQDHYVEVQQQHEELLDILEKRDYETVAAALAHHLDVVHAQLVSVYNSLRAGNGYR